MIEPVRDTGRLPPVCPEDLARGFLKRLHPRQWLGAARKLRDGAEIIIAHEQPVEDILNKVLSGELDNSKLEEFPNHAGAYLLYGYAFENLLKGLIVAKNPSMMEPTKWKASINEAMTADSEAQKIKSKRKAREPWMTHDMQSLIRQSGLDLPKQSVRLLWVLQGKVQWSARYPVAADVQNMVRYDDDGVPDAITMNSPKELREPFRYIEGELQRLADRLPSIA